MQSICGLLVINHVDGLSPESLLDVETWESVDCWVVSCVSQRAKEMFDEQLTAITSGANTANTANAGNAGNVKIAETIVEPERTARYQKGLRAAGKYADFALLFMPGITRTNHDLPAISDDADAVRLQYIGRNNQFRWRRMLVRSDLDWVYSDASAQWEPRQFAVADVVDKKTGFRENAQNQHVLIEWARQLQAQCALYRDDPQSEYLVYEIALSYLRMDEPGIAYDWFELLSGEMSKIPVHKSVAFTMMAHLNKSQLDVETRISLLQKAIEFWPNLADSYFYLASLLFKQGQVNQAMEVAGNWRGGLTEGHSALDCTMVHTRLPRLLAQCHAELGQHEQAISHYNQALHIPDKYYVASSEQDSQINMHQQRDSLYELAFPLSEVKREGQNSFKIIVAFWNAVDFLQNCVDSIAMQKYRRYEVIFVDDVSSDGGLTNIDLSALAAHRIVHQKNRQGPLKNQIEAALQYCDDEDIVVVLDGDDRLSDDGVLSHLNHVYAASGCWVTLGQFRVDEDWNRGYARPILPDEDVNQIFARQTLRFPVHLRSHRAGLLHRLQEQDQTLNAFRDRQGDFIFYASDVAYCRVIMSLAGARNIRYISRILMDYNVSNPRSVHHSNRAAQTASCIEIAGMEPIPPIPSYSK